MGREHLKATTGDEKNGAPCHTAEYPEGRGLMRYRCLTPQMRDQHEEPSSRQSVVRLGAQTSSVTKKGPGFPGPSSFAMAGYAGLEPATSDVTVRRSNQLS